MFFAVAAAMFGSNGIVFSQSMQGTDQPVQGTLRAMAQPQISILQAIQTATKSHQSTQVIDASLSDENGYLVYSVTLATGIEVKVDAGNGTILGTDRSDANREQATVESTDKTTEENNHQSGDRTQQ